MSDPFAETLNRKSFPRRAGPSIVTRLVIVHPPALARVIALGTTPVVLGRATLADGTVSRQHAEIRWEGLGHVIVDLESRNGTAVDGVALAAQAPRPLEDNDVVALGDVIGVYERGMAMGDAAAPDVSREAVPGESMATGVLRARLQEAGPDPAPALLLGETGVGKEFAARELHRLSGRRGPFVAVNVAELTHDLAESQLFGHERGAFTGADRAQPGLFRAAEGGTLFLDEIGELPLPLQPKLLRALQEREVRPVGQTKAIKVDVRVIGATHRDLVAFVEAEKFRRDLYARLAFWEIDVPPLRRRRADIVGWVARLHAAFAARRGGRRPPLELDAGAVERLLVEPWPENLRGLDRAVHKLAAFEHVTRELVAQALPPVAPPQPAVGTRPPVASSARAARETTPVVKRPAPRDAAELQAELERLGSVRAVAKHYGRDRRQVYRWLETFGLRDPGADEGDA